MKHEFSIPDMHCGHCKMRIEKALESSGKASAWTVDVGAKTVSVDSGSARSELAGILSAAGYPPAEA